MDYFFAQIEEVRNQEIKNRIAQGEEIVVAVCVFSGRTKDSGVISTVNYEGRKYGIKSAMPIVNAKRLAPKNSFFLPMDREHYQEVSETINKIIKPYFPNSCSQASIDEWNCQEKEELSKEKLEKEDLLQKGRKLKEEILKETKLISTIGISPSLLGAKICASKNKPNGLAYLDEKEERELIDNLDVIEIPGIGKATQTALNELAIIKVRDLKNVSSIELVEVFGRKLGAVLHELGNGKYQSKLEEEKESDEISRIGTLKEVTREKDELIKKIDELKSDIVQYLIENKKMFRTLSLIFVTDDMRTHTKSTSFRNPKTATSEIKNEIEKLLETFLKDNAHQIRRVGIRFGSLIDTKGQTTLF